MEKEEMIPVNDICMHYNIELSFIHGLQASGLVDMRSVDEEIYITGSQLGYLEKLARMHYDMDINLEGIEAITYLLQRIETMHDQINSLSSRLSRYESL